MSERTKDGGPAFPVPSHAPKDGMSLRDWFAGQALAGKLACPNTRGVFADVAKDAYAYADAMLKARSSDGG